VANPAFSAVVVGGGVVGSAVALALARRSLKVTLVEAEDELALAASGTNSGILHTGFDSVPGELETRLILRAAELRDEVLDTLGVPVVRCGALMPDAPLEVASTAARNGVAVRVRRDGALEIGAESVTDPVHCTLAFAAAAQAAGATARTGFRVRHIGRGGVVFSTDGDVVVGDVVVNCAGLFADEVARGAGDGSFEIFPRKGEFFVFEAALDRILLPVPSTHTKGVLVFPAVDGRVIAGPTAVDSEDKGDWTVRPEAREEVLARAVELHPPLAGLEPVAAYAGLRPAGRNANYVIRTSRVRPELIHCAAIRSTGLTAALGIAEHVADMVAAGRREAPLVPGEVPDYERPWYLRTARRRVAA
jgi:glycerol-3-phosphate dehydrogenase